MIPKISNPKSINKLPEDVERKVQDQKFKELRTKRRKLKRLRRAPPSDVQPVAEEQSGEDASAGEQIIIPELPTFDAIRRRQRSTDPMPQSGSETCATQT